jgi:hypothetical protein
MNADDSGGQVAPPHGHAAGLLRRLGSPAGIILAGLCLLLPFLSASCSTEERSGVQWRATYTGVDILARGRPTIAYTDDAARQPIHTVDDAELHQVLGDPPPTLPPQPLAWLAVALMAAALVATALSAPRWRVTASAGLSLAAVVLLWGATMLARHDALDVVVKEIIRTDTPLSAPAATVDELRKWEQDQPKVGDLVRYDYGFWIAIAALSAVGVANTVRVLRDPVFGAVRGRAARPPRP